MYNILRDLGVTYVSVGHRPSLLNYHKRKLILQGAGQPIILANISYANDVELIDLSSAGGGSVSGS